MMRTPGSTVPTGILSSSSFEYGAVSASVIHQREFSSSLLFGSGSNVELAPDPRLRRPAAAVGGDRIGDAAGEIDDQPEPELRDRRGKARRCDAEPDETD